MQLQICVDVFVSVLKKEIASARGGARGARGRPRPPRRRALAPAPRAPRGAAADTGPSVKEMAQKAAEELDLKAKVAKAILTGKFDPVKEKLGLEAGANVAQIQDVINQWIERLEGYDQKQRPAGKVRPRGETAEKDDGGQASGGMRLGCLRRQQVRKVNARAG